MGRVLCTQAGRALGDFLVGTDGDDGGHIPTAPHQGPSPAPLFLNSPRTPHNSVSVVELDFRFGVRMGRFSFPVVGHPVVENERD